MTETKDLREEILREQGQYDYLNSSVSMRVVYDAMDEFFTKRSMQLLEWMAFNKVECCAENSVAEQTGEQVFYYKGNWITKEELFENFL